MVLQRLIICFFSITLFSGVGLSQVGFGMTGSTDLYQRYVNPDDGLASPSSGSAMINFGAGPKIWFGGKGFSLSLEGQAVIGVFAFSVKDYKGLGSLAFPVMAKLNFGGLSGFDKESKMGFSLGGGLQYNRTEIFGLKDTYQKLGVTRDYFRTIVVQAGYGIGISGFIAQGFVRYGFSDDLGANSLNIGIQYDFNLPMLKKIADPASAL